jgi:hypothetical protein
MTGARQFAKDAERRRRAAVKDAREERLVHRVETDISREIRDALTKAGYWVERTNAGLARVRGGFMHLCSPGTPDTLIVAPVYGWLETKTDEGKLNEEQLYWHARARRLGVNVEVARGWQRALEIVVAWRKAS